MKCPHCGKRINVAKLLGAKGGSAGTGAAKARTSEQARAAANKSWEVRRAAKATANGEGQRTARTDVRTNP